MKKKSVFCTPDRTEVNKKKFLFGLIVAVSQSMLLITEDKRSKRLCYLVFTKPEKRRCVQFFCLYERNWRATGALSQTLMFLLHIQDKFMLQNIALHAPLALNQNKILISNER